MALYVQSEDMKNIARALQRRYPHNFGDLNLDRIIFLKELESPSKTKLALTKKVDAALKTVYHAADYLIIFFQKRLENLLPSQINVLVMHELMHCEPDGEKMRAHDVMEFYEIGAAFGIDWADNPNCRDPLAEGEQIILVPKPAMEPDQYAEIMEEDFGISSNVSSQYSNPDDDEE